MTDTPLSPRPPPPSAASLLRSTAIAALVAALLLVTVVMPAEYAIDPTGVGRLLGLQAMGQSKRSAAGSAAPALPPPAATAMPPATAVAAATAVLPAVPASAPAAPVRSDQVSVTLQPGEAAEMKLDMERGAQVRYRWATQAGAVTFDAHGESSENSFAVSYKKGRGASQDEGTLEAAFKGQHGWYWKNSGRQPVTVELRTEGAYGAIKRVL